MAVSDHELLERYRAGEVDAAERLMRRYEAALGRVVLRMVRRRAVAEEIVQETFLRMFQRIDQLDARQGLRSWLFCVAINLSRSQSRVALRSDLIGVPGNDDGAGSVERPLDPEQIVGWKERRERLEEAIGLLTPKLREVALLRYVEGLSFTEIAAAVGAPVPVLKLRAFRARAKLAASLREPEGT